MDESYSYRNSYVEGQVVTGNKHHPHSTHPAARGKVLLNGLRSFTAREPLTDGEI